MGAKGFSARLDERGGASIGKLVTMFYVYRIQSVTDPERCYTGFASDLKQRIRAHNAGMNVSTAPFRPWKLAFYAAFESKEAALEFERYLKTGSGKAFAGKRLWPPSKD